MTFRIHGEETLLNVEALSYIIEAWEEAICAGHDAETVAGASMFAALTDLVSTYGEEEVAKMARDLAERIDKGAFSLDMVTQ